MDKNKILSEINVIMNKKLQYIYRSCNLINLGFGNLVKNKRIDGKEVIVSSYAFHLQCPFRITDKNGVILGSDDMFVSMDSENKTIENEANSTLLDVRIKDFFSAYSNEFVKDIIISQYADLKIVLTNICIEIFMTGTSDDELFRFFQPYRSEKEHIVITGKGVELH